MLSFIAICCYMIIELLSRFRILVLIIQEYTPQGKHHLYKGAVVILTNVIHSDFVIKRLE